jgi:excisionase family DNA binding protein
MGMLCEPKGRGPGSVNRQIKNSEVAKMEELITIQQVADYLKVDRFTVYRLVTQKRIPAFKVGGQWRFKQEMIDSWLMRNSNMSEQRPPSS